jgi:hypothetical protein
MYYIKINKNFLHQVGDQPRLKETLLENMGINNMTLDHKMFCERDEQIILTRKLKA